LFRHWWDKKCVELDPKPGEPTMGRVSSVEGRKEARTGVCWKMLGWPVVSGETSNEPGDSWLSPKYI